MADASGQGFTASIVNSIPNYLSADRSSLGQINGETAAIQYVKLVWGNSGNAYFVDDQGDNPTPLPISLSNAENFWLYDAVLNTFKSFSGISAVNVNIVNSTGLCFAGVNLQVGAAVEISGATGSARGLTSNFGVTFGGITFSPVRIRNFVPPSGVTEPITVTFGNLIGGTLSIAGLSGSLNFGGGVTITGVSSGLTLPVHIYGGTLNGISNTVNVKISEVASGLTVFSSLIDKNGNYIGGYSGTNFLGIPVFGTSGATAVGVTFPAITGSVNVVSVPSITVTSIPAITGTVGISTTANTVKLDTSTLLLGISSANNTVQLASGTLVGISSANNTVKIQPVAENSGASGMSGGGTTFNSILTDVRGVPIGHTFSGASGAVFVGFPVVGVTGAQAINVYVVGGLSGITVSGLSLGTVFSITGGVTIAGGTLNSMNFQGGTFHFATIGGISGGTIGVSGIANPVKVVNDTGANLDVVVKNSTAIEVKLNPNLSDNTSLKTNLDGLVVSLTGAAGGGFSITGITEGLLGSSSIAGASKGLGVTFGEVVISKFNTTTADMPVSGAASSRTTAPVGVTLTGNLKGLTAVDISGLSPTFGTVLPSPVFAWNSAGSGGYERVGISGGALQVAIIGAGICFGSGITVSGISFGKIEVSGGITIAGGTFNAASFQGGTFHFTTIGNISGGTINVGNIPSWMGVTVVNGLTSGGNVVPLRVIMSDSNGTLFTDNANGVRVIGTTASPLYIQGWTTTPSGTTYVPIGVTLAGGVFIAPVSGNTGASGMSGGGTTFNSILTDVRGVPIGYTLTNSGFRFQGFPVMGVSSGLSLDVAPIVGTFGRVTIGGASASYWLNNLFFREVTGGAPSAGGVTQAWLGVTLSGTVSTTATLNFPSAGITVFGVGSSGIGGLSGFGSTFNVLLTDVRGIPLGHGLSGSTAVFFGLPMVGVTGGTPVGITLSGLAQIRPGICAGSGVTPDGGITFGMIPVNQFGQVLNSGISGGTFIAFPVVGLGAGATALNVTLKEIQFGGISISGSCAGSEVPPTSFFEGGTYFRVSPYKGTFNEPGVTLTGRVIVGGDSSSSIGVTFGGKPLIVEGSVYVGTTSGLTLQAFVSGGTAAIRPASINTGTGGMSGGGTTFNVVLTDLRGVPIGHGLSGSTATFTGFPVYGVSGATPAGVTFGPIVFQTSGLGVTFTGITFATTRTVIVGSSFADGGGNLGIPVYGVVGTTAVRVEVMGGTVAGLFVTEAPGITVMGVSTGIPVIGVSGGFPIAVTFGAQQSSLNLPASGITIASIASGVNVGVSGGTIGIGTIGGSVTVVQNTASNLKADVIGAVTVNPGSDFSSTKTQISAATGSVGFVVVQKDGPIFARGLTLDNLFIGVTDTVVPTTVGFSGASAFFLKTSPVCVTENYNGNGWDGGFIGAHKSVPLKQGLWVQLTKWDLISHVLIGYTADSIFEFERNAQVLTKEYQMAPIWAHAMDQFRRFPGFTGNNTIHGNSDFMLSSGQGDPLSTALHINMGFDGTNGIRNYYPVEKQFIGVIEKPTRIFIPSNNAARVYILVKGDYSNHGIGSGFWDHETGQWSATTLYERSYFSSSFSGFIPGEPALGTDGSTVASGSPYSELNVFEPTATPVSMDPVPSPAGSPGTAIAQILASYTNNPFIRVWGM